MTQILHEIEFQYRTNLAKTLEPYLGKGYFIHFSNVNKLGVRTKTFHSDPHGVYFYDLDWLYRDKRFSDGEQYATQFPYWFIVKLNPSPNGIVMSELTDEKLDDLAAQRGWDISDGDGNPAKRFWNFVNIHSPIRRTKDMPSHNEIVKGIPYIHDDGMGIIHNREKNQLFVRDIRSITLVDSGVNASGGDSKAQGNNTILAILTNLRGQYGGAITWNKKLPSWSAEKNGAKFSIRIDGHSLYSYALEMNVEWGRAKNFVRVPLSDLERVSLSDAVSRFSSVIDKTAMLSKAGKDLFFTPPIPIEAMEDEVRSAGIDDFVTSINNHRKTVTVGKTVTGKTNDVSFAVVLEYETWAREADEDDRIRALFVANIQGYVVANTTKSNIEECIHSVRDALEERFPEVDPSKYRYSFTTERDRKAAMGWLVSKLSISKLSEIMKEEIAAFESYPYGEDDLLRTIRLAF